IGILKFLYMNVPPEWKEDFVTNSKSRLTNREQQAWIDKAMQRSDDDTSAIPDEYGMDTVSGSVVDNTNYQPKQKLVKENTTLGGQRRSICRRPRLANGSTSTTRSPRPLRKKH
ncbi:hypothetical protein, partial [Pseudomonas amygdali]